MSGSPPHLENRGAVYDTAPCVGCGLCCDGTLYNVAKVAPGEEALLQSLGLTLTASADRTSFTLPCRFHESGRCTIYEDRWTVCRTFRCALLRKYQAGEVGIEEARAMVERALQLKSAVAAADPAALTVLERRQARRELADKLPGADQGIARRLINIIALDTYLERNFRNPKKTAVTPGGETLPDASDFSTSR